MRVLFFGTPEFAVPSLAALVEAGHAVACVVAQPDRPSGRRRQLVPSPVKQFALDHRLPIRQSEDVNDAAFVDGLAALRAELAVVAAFGQKLGPRLLALPPHGFLNVHASLLPRHRGAAPVAHAILAGDAETGVTIMQVVERMDAGDILLQESTAVGPTETTGELTARLAVLGARLLLVAIGQIAGGWAQPVPQDPAKRTRAPSFQKDDGLVDWTRPAAHLARFVRAMTPWPGAFTFWHGSGREPVRLVLLKVGQEWKSGGVEEWKSKEEGEERRAVLPGTVMAVEEGTIAVQTGEGVLRITELQPAGKRAMAAAEFLRGHRVEVGEVFGESGGAEACVGV